MVQLIVVKFYSLSIYLLRSYTSSPQRHEPITADFCGSVLPRYVDFTEGGKPEKEPGNTGDMDNGNSTNM